MGTNGLKLCIAQPRPTSRIQKEPSEMLPFCSFAHILNFYWFTTNPRKEQLIDIEKRTQPHELTTFTHNHFF